VALVAALATVAAAPPARACSYPALTPHVIDPAAQAVDHTPPATPALTVEKIKRGQGPRNDGCGSSASSCDDFGVITLANPTADDQTPVEAIGYRFALVSGAFPVGFALPTDTIGKLVTDGRIFLPWLDGADDDQDSIDFTLEIVAVDAAGNTSAPQTLRIRDDQSGCGVAPVRGPVALEATFILFVAITAASRRRRAR
jgi:hypothetical protein